MKFITQMRCMNNNTYNYNNNKGKCLKYMSEIWQRKSSVFWVKMCVNIMMLE